MMTSNIHLHRYAKRDLLLHALSRRIAKDLREAIEKRSRASLMVSGGKTPQALFEMLSQEALPWEKVSVGLVDERWVSPEHAESNERLVKTYLLQGKASSASFIGMYHEGVDAYEAQEICHQRIKNTLWPFDVVILGMGNDGHTASLFPHNSALKKGLAIGTDTLCIAVQPGSALHMRMSLTLRAILAADHLYLHFEGEDKVAVFEEAMEGMDVDGMPIRAVLHQPDKEVEVYYR
jgi:6-phosphogluconolactonase